jgi:hypothetical protein
MSRRPREHARELLRNVKAAAQEAEIAKLYLEQLLVGKV